MPPVDALQVTMNELSGAVHGQEWKREPGQPRHGFGKSLQSATSRLQKHKQLPVIDRGDGR